MASHHQHQEAGYKADDEMSTGGHAYDLSRSSGIQQQHDQNTSFTSQASNFLQQTGVQMKNMAQGAAEAVKSTLGITADNPASPNPSGGSISNNPSGINPTASAGNHPSSVTSFASGGQHPSGTGVSPNPTASAGSHPSNPSSGKF